MPKSSIASRMPRRRRACRTLSGVVADERGLGDFEDQALRGQPGVAQRGLDFLDEARLLELGARDVDAQVRSAAPGRGLARGVAQHPAPERDDQSGLLGERDELARAEQAALGMLPAHERLEARVAAEVEVDDRLVVQDQFLVLDRALELLAAVEAGDGVGVQVGGEDRAAVRARGLGGVHREVGVAQQVVAGVGARDPDARAQVQALALEHHRRREHAEQAGDERLGLIGPGGEDGELVAAEAGDGVAGAQCVAQAVAGDLQQAVARGVAERVVDPLEVVEVEEGDDRVLAGGERLGDALLEQRPVREPRQRILEGEAAQLPVARAAAAGAVQQRQQRRSSR